MGPNQAPKAARAGSEASGLAYSGSYDFAPTVMYWRINHMVAPASEALKCNDCHKEPNLFEKKKTAKITEADHKGPKYCGACHDGKKAFAMTEKADCAKCHKK